MECPGLEDLERHVEGRLDEATGRDLEAHVSDCARCVARLGEISANLQAVSGFQDALRNADVDEAGVLPARIGAFEIVSEIARGGMGIVYLAIQDRPRRKVALKILRSHFASSDTLRRFELEAELLARVQHPGIATVFEAGVTTLRSSALAERVPFIAMEYIEGERLDRYAQTRRLSLEQRVELLAKIADALHHAHVKGLVHRDLKPGNILVERVVEDEEVGNPKILDFGVARWLDRERGESAHTSAGQILGTVPYMSPEQVSGEPAAVDARSDVYGLGVVGFELLTGELPYESTRTSMADLARRIRDEPPRRPRDLDERLAGDVETVLLKALEKDPARRYASAAELAADLRRFLRREPIQARPQSAAYQLQRFAQRNRALVGVALALVLAVTGAALVSGLLAARAMRAELQARQGLEELRVQAEKVEALNRFMEQMLTSASPEDHPGKTEVTVREALERSIRELDEGSLASQPPIEMAVRTTIGDTYRSLGLYAPARAQLQRAVDLGRELIPEEEEKLALALNKLGQVQHELGEYGPAEESYRECLSLRERIFGENHVDVAATLNNVALVYSARGDNDAALELHERALAIRRRILGEAHVDIATSLNNMAGEYYAKGDLENARDLLHESLTMDTSLRGEFHPNVASTMSSLGVVTAELGDTAEAERLYRKAIDLARRIYGSSHPQLATYLQNLARLLAKAEDYEQSEQMFVEALGILRATRGNEHPAVATTLGNYAMLHMARGDFDRAEQLHRDALAIRRATFGDDGRATLGSRFNLARLADARGDRERAEREFQQLASHARRVLSENDPLRTAILGEAQRAR